MPRRGRCRQSRRRLVSREAFKAIDRAAAAGNAKARDLVSYFVGQGVGLIDSVKSAGTVVQE